MGARMAEAELRKPLGLSGEVLDRYTYGQCHALALAFHYLVRWPIMVFSTADEQAYWDNEPCNCHAVVRHPSGKLLDVHGLWDPYELELKWRVIIGAKYSFMVGHDGFDSWTDIPDMDAALPLAQQIIDTLEVQT